MSVWRHLRAYARWSVKRKHTAAFFWIPIALVTFMGVYGILRGLIQADWATFGWGFAFLGLAAAYFLGDPFYWFSWYRDRRRRRDHSD